MGTKIYVIIIKPLENHYPVHGMILAVTINFIQIDFNAALKISQGIVQVLSPTVKAIIYTKTVPITHAQPAN